MSHSKTPWRQVDTTIEDADGYLILDCRFGSKEECVANAKRIAACVNKFSEISDDNMEDMHSSVLDIARVVSSLKSQRDELLHTLQQIARGEYCEGEEVEMARAAIAVCGGDV